MGLFQVLSMEQSLLSPFYDTDNVEHNEETKIRLIIIALLLLLNNMYSYALPSSLLSRDIPDLKFHAKPQATQFSHFQVTSSGKTWAGHNKLGFNDSDYYY